MSDIGQFQALCAQQREEIRLLKDFINRELGVGAVPEDLPFAESEIGRKFKAFVDNPPEEEPGGAA